MDVLRTPEALPSEDPTANQRQNYQPRASAHRRAAKRPQPLPDNPDELSVVPQGTSLTDLAFSVFVGLVAWLALIWAIRAAMSILG